MFLPLRVLARIVPCLLGGLLLVGIWCTGASAAERVVRVWIFPSPPLNYLDSNGTAQGLYPDLLRAVAKAEGWSLSFIPGSWGEGLKHLQANDVDLLIAIARTPAREYFMDFNQEPVAELWSQVFAAPGHQIESILDLDNRRVGIMKKSIEVDNFAATAEMFKIKTELVKFATHEQIFAALRQGEIVAGIVPQLFGFKAIEEYGLIATPIQFTPFSIYFASNKESNNDLLQTLDRYLKEWKAQSNSLYYQRLSYWLTGEGAKRSVVPTWFYLLGLAGVGMIVLLVYLSTHLSRRLAMRSRQIKASEYRFNALVESANVIPWKFNLHSRSFLFIGGQVRRMLGHSATGLLALHAWQKWIYAEDWESFAHFFEAMTDQRHAGDVIFRINDHTGSEHWLRCSKTAAKIKQEPYLVVGFMIDITAIKVNERELQASESKYRQLFNEAAIGIGVVDRTTGTFIAVNYELSRLLGRSADELSGLPTSALQAVAVRQQITDNNGDPFLQLEPKTARVALTTAAGAERTLLLTRFAITLDTHEVIQIFVRDITELTQAEDEIERHRYLLESSQQLGKIGSWEVRLAGTKKMSWTAETCRILGIPLDTAPTLEAFRQATHPDDRDRVAKTWRTALREGNYDIEHRLQVDSGSRWVRVKGTPSFDGDGKACCVTGFIQDISEEKFYKQALLDKNVEMERFLYTASHDLKSPLVTIRSFLEILKNDVANRATEKISKDFDFLEAAANHMCAQLDGLLHYSQLGQTEAPPAEKRFSEIVAGVLQVLAGSIMTSEVKIDVCAADLTLRGNITLLTELWQNLIENAIKFRAERGAPCIEIGFNGEGHDIVFYVRDNGIGIQADFRNKIFELFEQLDQSQTGTGLGLSIVKRVVDLYGGRIWIDTRSKRVGTCFRFTLPNALVSEEN